MRGYDRYVNISCFHTVSRAGIPYEGDSRIRENDIFSKYSTFKTASKLELSQSRMQEYL
ncbi:MAG: hypothetical protein NT007_17345 [Candidatus Kapabacteria bacterium]|nr:hypothetical protein [Candidatus Kapabacteria bacterium]